MSTLKRNSAANAIHHGMLANSYVLNGEARERFERILDRLNTSQSSDVPALGVNETFAYRMFMRSQRQLKAIRLAEIAAQKGETIDCEANPDIDLAQ